MSSSALFFCEAIESLSILLSFVPFWHKASFSCVYRIFLRRCLKISNNWFQRVYCPNGFVEAAGLGAYHIFAGSGNALEGGKRRPGRLGEDQACLCINRKGSFFSVCFKERRHVCGSKEWKEFLTTFCFWWLICGRKKHGNVQEVLHRCVHMPMYTCINVCVCAHHAWVYTLMCLTEGWTCDFVLPGKCSTPELNSLNFLLWKVLLNCPVGLELG